MSLKVVVDSASNLHEIKGIDYAIAPLTIYTDEREFYDENLDIEEMANYMEHTKKPSHTTCPNTDQYLKCFGEADAVIGVTLAGVLSGSYNACSLAAQQYVEEHPERKAFALNTCSIGPGEKLVIEYIKQLSEEGKSFEEIVDAIQTYASEKLHLIFCLKSMTNIANNGRINPAVAVIAQTLGIRIVGEFDPTGALVPKDKVRGEKKALATIVKNMKEAGYKGGKIRIDHCMAPESTDALVALIRAEFPNADIACDITTGLCTYYAERGGLIISFEKN